MECLFAAECLGNVRHAARAKIIRGYCHIDDDAFTTGVQSAARNLCSILKMPEGFEERDRLKMALTAESSSGYPPNRSTQLYALNH